MYEDGWRNTDVMLDGNPYGQSALRYLKEIENQVSDRSWLELHHDIPTNKHEVSRILIWAAGFRVLGVDIMLGHAPSLGFRV
jgi:ribulose 1,5-bisphosphate carboxylase large subunit-like protein